MYGQAYGQEHIVHLHFLKILQPFRYKNIVFAVQFHYFCVVICFCNDVFREDKKEKLKVMLTQIKAKMTAVVNSFLQQQLQKQ